jgi:hypothetical protein
VFKCMNLVNNKTDVMGLACIKKSGTDIIINYTVILPEKLSTLGSKSFKICAFYSLSTPILPYICSHIKRVRLVLYIAMT